MEVDGFSNAYQTTLNGAINNSQTSLVVTTATGAPATVPFRLRIRAEGANTNEIVTVTAVASTTYTITRASEAYNGVQSASAHASGATVEHVLTAGGLMTLATGELGYIEDTNAITVPKTQTSYADVSTLSLTISVGTRPIKVTAYTAGFDSLTGTGIRGYLGIYDVTGAATKAGAVANMVATNGSAVVTMARLNPGAGTRTYKVQAKVDGGSATDGRLLGCSLLIEQL